METDPAAHRHDSGNAPTGNRLLASKRSTLLGAMFLMSTAAIGPGFLTQTADFTNQIGAAFAFAIVISIIVDIALQLNIWRVIGISGQRAHSLGNLVLPGLGWLMSIFIVIGGLVFNIGNLSGAGLGTDSMFGLEPRIGGAITAVLAIGLFLYRRAGRAMDRLVVALGFVMIALTVYVAISSSPPVGTALKNVVLPDTINFFMITTLIGGTIGGYITYSGAHRLIDSNVTGPESSGTITKASVTGVLITGLMRIILFLAVLGVVAGGATLASDNPPGSAFQIAAGDVGLRIFGIVIWAAAISSVIGAAYTSVSFLTTVNGMADRMRSWLTGAFILISGIIFVFVGSAPVKLLIFAGAFNGIILPIGVAIVLWVAWRRRDLLHGYVYPKWLAIVGTLAWLFTIYSGYNSLSGIADLF